MAKTRSKIIDGLEQALAHSRDNGAQEVSRLVRELMDKLSGNTSFSEVNITQKAGKIQADIVFSSGMRATIFEADA